MSPERWQEVKAVLDAALNRPAPARAGYLEDVCADDAPLRAEVDSLLAAETEVWDFLDEPIFSLNPPLRDDNATGRQIGPYRLEERIGRGGMGTVYRARRTDEYEQIVAMKLLRPGMASAGIVERFRAERQILAELTHPNIARLLDGGTTPEGLPFLVMEHVDGEPIDRALDQRRATVRERLQLFLPVCEAVAAAHRRLVVHRDLKPANILLDSQGTPKLLDFGIAKILSPDASPQAPATEVGLRILTPGFASPEQLHGRPITTASDVYGLGVLLYVLLTGRPPAVVGEDGTPAPPMALSQVVERQAPPPPDREKAASPEQIAEARRETPASLRRRLLGDLDAIVNKALRDEPEMRYPSAAALAEDVRRHLEGFPVGARHDQLGYTTRRFLGRHWLATGVSIATMIGLAMFGLRERHNARQLLEANVELSQALDRAEGARDLMVDVFAAAGPERAQGQEITARALLEQSARKFRETARDDPELLGDMLELVARAYRALGNYSEAAALLREALEIRIQGLGPRHKDVGLNLMNLGNTLIRRNQLEEAENLATRGIEILESHHDEQDITLLRARQSFGVLLSRRERYDAAADLLARTLADFERLLGPEDPLVASIAMTLATTERRRGNFEASKTLFERALRITREQLGTLHPDYLTAANGRAFLAKEQGDLVLAEALFREVVDARRQVLDPDHPDLAIAINNHASALHDQGDLRTAEAGYREVIASLEARLGSEHVHTATAWNNLAKVLTDLGRVDEAIAILEPLASELRARYPGGRTVLGLALRNLADALSRAARHQEAIAAARQALVIFSDRLGADHHQVHTTRNILGGCLAEGGELDEGRAMITESLASLEKLVSPTARQIREARARAARYQGDPNHEGGP